MAAVSPKAPKNAKLSLIAWDTESSAHTERMLQQRIACGWKHDYVEKWRVLQREGKMAIQWVVSEPCTLPCTLPCKGEMDEGFFFHFLFRI